MKIRRAAGSSLVSTGSTPAVSRDQKVAGLKFKVPDNKIQEPLSKTLNCSGEALWATVCFQLMSNNVISHRDTGNAFFFLSCAGTG